jgi:hypothetical protein
MLDRVFWDRLSSVRRDRMPVVLLFVCVLGKGETLPLQDLIDLDK